MMKILYSWGHHGEWRKSIQTEIAEWQRAGFDVTGVDHREITGLHRTLRPWELDALHREGHPGLCKLYETVRALSERADVLMVNYENPYHPQFITALRDRIYTVLISGDDPDASEHRSKPYVASYDHSFAWGVRFDDQAEVAHKFVEWGAPRADWWPHGVGPTAYDRSLTVEGIYRGRRDVDVVFVGSGWGKAERLLRLKRHFRSRFVVYGEWGKKFCLKHRVWVKPLPWKDLIPLYQRAKIGINVHLTYGPCNLRLYELPANGVMQICDCADGLGKVFEIGKEVIAYRTIDEAIDLIEYYLAHEEERKAIAARGFQRVLRDYTRLTTFSRALSQVQQAMLARGIAAFKDGTSVVSRTAAAGLVGSGSP